MSRVVALLNAVATHLQPLVADDIRVQMDPLDLDMVENESFREECLRVVFAVAKPEKTAIGRPHLAVTFGLFVICKSDVENGAVISADLRAINLAIAAIQKIHDDDYVGLTKMSNIETREFRVFDEHQAVRQEAQ